MSWCHPINTDIPSSVTSNSSGIFILLHSKPLGGRAPVTIPALTPEAERKNQDQGPHPTPHTTCTSGVPLLPSSSVVAWLNPGCVPSTEDSAVCGARLSLAQPSCAAAVPVYSWRVTGKCKTLCDLQLMWGKKSAESSYIIEKVKYSSTAVHKKDLTV